MNKMKTMNRAACRTIQEEMMKALKPVADKFGLTVEYDGARFSSTQVTAKVKWAVVTETVGTDGASKAVPANFAADAVTLGLKPEHYGATFKSGRTEYRITGIKMSRYKYPVSAERVKDGRGFKFPVAMVLGGLPNASAPAVRKTVVPKFNHGDRVTFSGLFGKEPKYGVVDGGLKSNGRYPILSSGGQVHLISEDELTTYMGKRSEAEIMEDFMGAYCALSPENLTCDGERSRYEVRLRAAEIRRWLSHLATEYGRVVEEHEAYDWARHNMNGAVGSPLC